MTCETNNDNRTVDENSNLVNDTEANSPASKKYFDSVTAEPVKFLIMFGIRCSEVIIQNFFVDSICRNHLEYGSEVCRDLSKHVDKEIAVEKVVEKYFVVYRSVIQSVFPAILVLFLGPVSDKYGRKGE